MRRTGHLLIPVLAAAGIVVLAAAGTSLVGLARAAYEPAHAAQATPVLVVAGDGSALAEKTPTDLGQVTVGTPGTPVALASDGTFFTWALIQAGRATADNDGDVSVGGDTAYTSNRQTELAPGGSLLLQPPAGTKWDLNDWYLDGADTDDGVRVRYVAP